jgi:hypothetical protein
MLRFVRVHRFFELSNYALSSHIYLNIVMLTRSLPNSGHEKLIGQLASIDI